MAVEFRLLGEVEALAGDRVIPIGSARSRCVLAVLLVEANRVVPVEALVDRVWGGRDFPRRPRAVIQQYIASLRKALAGTEIAWRSTGYELRTDPETVDLQRFRALINRARACGDDEALFAKALAQWRGEPLAGLDTPWLNAVRAALIAELEAARLDRVDVALRLGRHARVLVELADAVRLHPLDERRAGQYLLALYRSGRRADALEHYRTIRRRLVDELGTEPGPPLRLLHQQILTADPVLAPPVTATHPVAVPRQLPARPRMFTGRGVELARLTSALGESGRTVAIGGAGGIGKTWLAVYWAHEHLDEFPDGQLYVNLRGFDPTGRPMLEAVALRGLLDALGADPAAIPQDFEAQAGLYQSLLAGRRMLLVLDNAADAAQIGPLLPDIPSCVTLVTSRRHLTGLAEHVDLDTLGDAEARELLGRYLGRERVAAEPAAVDRLLAACAGLPLALGIVAARAARHPDFALAVLADELDEHTSRLDSLDVRDGNANLRVVFSWSHRALSTSDAELFALLGRAPGPDIGLPAAAALARSSIVDAERTVRELWNVHLIRQPAPGRYRMHDLIRLYAAEQPVPTLTAALHRLVHFYLHTAFAAERTLDPYRPPIDLAAPLSEYRLSFPDEPAAMDWFRTEHPNLLAIQEIAAERGWRTEVWQLAWTMDTFHFRAGQLRETLAVWRLGLTAADLLGDKVVQSQAHRLLGHASVRAGDHPAAVRHLQESLALAEQAGDLAGRAGTHGALALAWERHGDDRQALEHATHALRLYERLALPMRVANLRNAVGWYHARLGDYEQAQAHCTEALALFRDQHHRDGEADTLDSLGYIAAQTGQHAVALDHYRAAIALFGELGHINHEANTLDRMAQSHHALGHHDDARDTWQRALDLYRAQRSTKDIERVEQQLTTLGVFKTHKPPR